MPPEPQRPLHVLLVAEWFVKYTAGLAGGLRSLGVDVTLLTRAHDLEFGGEPGAMRRFVAEAAGAGTRHLVLEGRVRDPARIRDVVALRREVRRFAPDVVHVQDSIAHDLRLAWIAGLRPGRYAVTVHDPVPHPGDPVPSARIRTTRATIRREAGLCFVHSDALRTAVDRLGHARGPMFVVPHGMGDPIDVGPPSAPVLLFFGRISPYKGLDTLADAMPAVWAAVPEARLLIAGEGSLPDSAVFDDPRVEVHNEHIREEDVGRLFTEAACVVLPYREGSQSGVAAVAKQYGRAIVATDVGGLSDVVHREDGRLVAPDEPAALASALVEVLATPGLAARMSSAAHRWAEEATWARVAARSLEAYERWLPRSEARVRRGHRQLGGDDPSQQ